MTDKEKTLRDNLLKAINQAVAYDDDKARKNMLMDALLYIAEKAGVAIEMRF